MLLISLITMVALLSLGGLMILSVRGGTASTGHDRFQQIALYAAESGIATGMDFLRDNLVVDEYWSGLVSPNNDAPQSPVGIAGNGAKPGTPGNLFTPGIKAWYEVTIYNNVNDPGFAAGTDNDGIVVLRVVGHGPNGATMTLEQGVSLGGGGNPVGRPCPTYGQKNITEEGSGRNDCLEVIEAADQATFKPGG